MDVTDIVKGWLSGSRPNDGLRLIKSVQMNLQIKNMVEYHFSQRIQILLYFHLKLEFAWDDSSFSTGRLSRTYNREDKIVYFQQFEREYVDGEESEI